MIIHTTNRLTAVVTLGENQFFQLFSIICSSTVLLSAFTFALLLNQYYSDFISIYTRKISPHLSVMQDFGILNILYNIFCLLYSSL